MCAARVFRRLQMNFRIFRILSPPSINSCSRLERLRSSSARCRAYASMFPLQPIYERWPEVRRHIWLLNGSDLPGCLSRGIIIHILALIPLYHPYLGINYGHPPSFTC